MSIPLGRALSILLTTQKSSDLASAQANLLLQKKSNQSTYKSTSISLLTSALLTIDSALQSNTTSNTNNINTNDNNSMSFILSPILDVLSAPITDKKSLKRKKHVSKVCEWILGHTTGGPNCHKFFNQVLKNSETNKRMKLSIVQLLRDQMSRGVFRKIRKRIVSVALATAMSKSSKSSKSSNSSSNNVNGTRISRVSIQVLNEDESEMKSSNNCDDISQTSSISDPTLDSLKLTIQGLLWSANHDGGNNNKIPTRLTMSCIDCIIRICFHIGVVIDFPSSTTKDRLLPYWKEITSAAEKQNSPSSSSSAPTQSSIVSPSTIAVSNVDSSSEKEICQKVATEWLWKVRSVLPSVIDTLKKWSSVSNVGRSSLLSLALNDIYEELYFWSGLHSQTKEIDTTNIETDKTLMNYDETNNMREVAEIVKRKHQNAVKSDAQSSPHALSWHWRLYAPFLASDSRALRPPPSAPPPQTNAKSEKNGKFEGSSHLEDLLGEYEGWLRQLSTSASGVEEEEGTAAVAMRCLSLMMGRCDIVVTSRHDSIIQKNYLHDIIVPTLGSSGFLQGPMMHMNHRSDQTSLLVLEALRCLLFGSSNSSNETKTSGGVDHEVLLSSLETMLDQDGDQISKTAVVLISDIARRNPANVLPSLFARLGGMNGINSNTANDADGAKKSLSRRRNALEVMAELFNANSDDDGTINPFLCDSNVARLVVKHLVDRIEDEELSIRCRASSLFATLSPALVLPPLCARVVSASDKVRSAAESALNYVMTRHGDPIETMSTLIDCLRHHGESDGSSKNDQRILDRVLRSAPVWVDNVGSNNGSTNGSSSSINSRRKVASLQSELLLSLINKMFAAPDDVVLVRLMTSAMRANCVENSIVVIKNIWSLLILKMSSQTSLNENILNQKLNGAEHVQALLFARTSPLLVLRAMPVPIFQKYNDTEDIEEEEGDIEEEEGDIEEEHEKKIEKSYEEDKNKNMLAYKSVRKCLCQQLMSRIFQVYEYEQVRKLSAEIMGRMPIQQYSAKYCGTYLEYFCRRASSDSSFESSSYRSINEEERSILFEAGADMTVGRAVIYTLCHATMLWCDFSNNPISAAQSLQCMKTFVLPWLLRLLSFDLIMNDEDKDGDEISKGLEKLQRGTMDCVACLCKASHLLFYNEKLKNSFPSSNSLVVDITESGETKSIDKFDDANNEKVEESINHWIIRILCGDVQLSDVVAELWSDSERSVQSSVFTLSSSQTLRICVANVLITSMKMWPQEGETAPTSSNEVNAFETSILPKSPKIIIPGGNRNNTNSAPATKMTPKLYFLSTILHELIESCLEQKDMNPVVRGALIQVLFIGLHAHGKGSDISSTVSIPRLHALAMGACQDSSSDQVRMSGLKLLGMMIGKIPNLFTKTLLGAGGHTKSVISQLAHIDTSKDIRQMAENIHYAAFEASASGSK
jgi:hypothetical protein